MSWTQKRVNALIDTLDELTDRTQGEVADHLGAASECLRELTKEPETQLVPISVYQHIGGDTYAHEQDGANLNAKQVLVEAPPGTKVTLTKSRSLMLIDKLLIVEVKHGDELIWPAGILDAAFLPELPFEGIKIRDGEPLEFYVQTRWQTPDDSGGEIFNACFFGKMTVVDQRCYEINRRADSKTKFVHVHAFRDWLPDTQQGRRMAEVVGQYCRGEEPDLRHIIMEELTVRTAQKMKSSEWLKFFRHHLDSSNESFAKQALFAARTRLRRLGVST